MPFGAARVREANAGVADTHNVRRLVLRNVPHLFGRLGVALGRNEGGLRGRRLVMVVLVHLGLRIDLRLLVHRVIGMRAALVHERLIVIVLSLVIVILLMLLHRLLVRIDGGGESRGYLTVLKVFGSSRGFGNSISRIFGSKL